MTRSIQRLFFFAAAVMTGAALFWSAHVQARSSGGPAGPYCGDGTTAATMCMNGTTIMNVSPPTQSAYLANHQATCGPCATSPN